MIVGLEGWFDCLLVLCFCCLQFGLAVFGLGVCWLFWVNCCV